MKKKLLSLVINLILMALFIVAVVYGTLYGIDRYTHHDEAIIVPDVRGMSAAEAATTFERHGLNSMVSDSIYVKDQLPGRVLDYSPAMGKRVKQGRIVYLTINTNNIPLKLVPDVADNSSVRQAHARMLASGFKLEEDELISGQKDWVYEVKFRGEPLVTGAMVPIGSTLKLVVGDGTEILTDTINNELDSLAIDANALLEGGAEENSWFQ